MTATTSIPLAALPAPIDPTRRDQWGRYLVLPPDGDKPVGYTRATTVAGALDDGYGLQKWLATMSICVRLRRREGRLPTPHRRMRRRRWRQ
jgi:hypothetical protein